jgi:hypothetical protein
MFGEGDEIADFSGKRNSVVKPVIICGEKFHSQSKSANKTKCIKFENRFQNDGQRLH